MFLFYPFHSFSRFLPIQRGRFGCDLCIFVACSQCPKKVVSFSICFARQVAVVARARKRWSWSCQRIRSRNPQLFCFFLAGQEYPELEFSLDHWPPFFVRVLIADTVRRIRRMPGQDYRTNCSQTMHMPTVSQWARIERFVHLENQQSLVPPAQVRDGPLFETCLQYVIVTWSFIKCWLLLWITGFC